MSTNQDQKKNRPHTSQINRNKSALNRPKSGVTNKIEENKNQNKKDFRFLRPSSSIKDSAFQKHFDDKNDQTLKLISQNNNLNTIRLQNEGILQNNAFEYYQNYDSNSTRRGLYKLSKIDWEKRKQQSFLTSIGGIQTNPENFCLNQNFSSNNTFNTNLTTEPNSKFRSTFIKNGNQRPQTTSNIDHKNRLVSGLSNKTATMLKELERPETAKISKPPLSANNRFRPFSGKEGSNKGFPPLSGKTDNMNKGNINNLEYQAAIDELVEDSLSIDLDQMSRKYKKSELIETRKENNFPKVKSLLDNCVNINFKASSIKIMTADSDLLDIFDRSQRTRAATLSRTGDYDYYTPFQRIGSFMDFCMSLKWMDLKNVQKSVFYSGNQVSYLTTKRNANSNTNYSLFHGLMKNEGEYKHYYESILNNKQLTYDPEYFLTKVWNPNLYNHETWDVEIKKKIVCALTNFKKYLNSEKIVMNDLHTFDSNLKRKFLKHIEFEYRHNIDVVEIIFDEIIEEYYVTLKKIILEYILLSPYERHRLNILYYPRRFQPSSFTIASNGGFNRNIYTGWVDNYYKNSEFLSKNLHNCNIINATLIDWVYSFKHLECFYLKNLNSFRNDTKKTINIEEFNFIQNNYMQKIHNFLRDIFYRGVILILKKNKIFKRKLILDGRWSFKGFLTKENSEELVRSMIYTESYETHSNNKFNFDFNNADFGMDYLDELEDFWSNVKITDLVDIRITPSYFAYVTIFKKQTLDLKQSEYEKLDVENKLKLNHSVSAYISIFFRNLIEKSTEQLVSYIMNYKFNDDILNQVTKIYNLNEEIFFKKNEIKLPQLKAFQLRNYVDPILSIKIIWDSKFSLIKLEHSIDKVLDIFLKLIDNCVTLFNSFCTTHFLDFKTVGPSDLEKVQKEHWSKINEIFQDIRAKTFANDYFLNFAPNIIIDEVKVENYMKTYLQIGDKNETHFTELKNKISKHLKRHYSEIEECLNVFKPMKELVNGNLQESINLFLETVTTVPDYNKYSIYIEKINLLRRYVFTIPNSINYSLFAADTTEVKRDMIKRLDELQNGLMKTLEDMILSLYNSIFEKFTKMKKQLDKKLLTPEDIADMDKIKNNLVFDTSAIGKEFDDSYKIIHYLLGADHLFSDNLIYKTDEVIKCQKKFREFQEDIEKSHNKDRENLENKHKIDKQELEKETLEFSIEISQLEGIDHLNSYETTVHLIEELQNKIDSFNSRIAIILKNEDMLFNYKLNSFEEYDKSLIKLDKYSIFWKKVQMFYDMKKNFITNFQVDLNDFTNKIDWVRLEIESFIEEMKSKLKKEDENFLLHCFGYDIDTFIEVVSTLKDILEVSELDGELRNKILFFLNDKKLENGYKQILNFVIQHQKITNWL